MRTIYRRYGEAAVINFALVGLTGEDFAAGAAHAAGDTQISKDEGAQANTTNGFTDEGNFQALTLTAAEMQAKRIVFTAVDQDATKVWADFALCIETTDHQDAQHPNGVVRRATAQDGDATEITLDAGASATNEYYRDDLVEIVAGTGAGQKNYITAYNGTSKVATVKEAWFTNPDNTSVFEIRRSIIGLRAVTETRLAELDSANLPNDVDALLTWIDDAIPELAQAAPTATPTVKEALMLLYMAMRNDCEATATERRIKNDAGTVIAKGTMADDGTTFNQGELVSGA